MNYFHNFFLIQFVVHAYYVILEKSVKLSETFLPVKPK